MYIFLTHIITFDTYIDTINVVLYYLLCAGYQSIDASIQFKSIQLNLIDTFSHLTDFLDVKFETEPVFRLAVSLEKAEQTYLSNSRI